MFVLKGYCRYCGTKCIHLKLKDGVGRCKKDRFKRVIRDIKTCKPKNISLNPNVNIKAPDWCPKL